MSAGILLVRLVEVPRAFGGVANTGELGPGGVAVMVSVGVRAVLSGGVGPIRAAMVSVVFLCLFPRFTWVRMSGGRNLGSCRGRCDILLRLGPWGTGLSRRTGFRSGSPRRSCSRGCEGGRRAPSDQPVCVVSTVKLTILLDKKQN